MIILYFILKLHNPFLRSTMLRLNHAPLEPTLVGLPPHRQPCSESLGMRGPLFFTPKKLAGVERRANLHPTMKSLCTRCTTQISPPPLRSQGLIPYTRLPPFIKGSVYQDLLTPGFWQFLTHLDPFRTGLSYMLKYFFCIWLRRCGYICMCKKLSCVIDT